MPKIDEMSRILHSALDHADKAHTAIKQENYGIARDELYYSSIFLDMFRRCLHREGD